MHMLPGLRHICSHSSGLLIQPPHECGGLLALALAKVHLHVTEEDEAVSRTAMNRMQGWVQLTLCGPIIASRRSWRS